MMSKVIDLKEAVSFTKPNAVIGLGGNTLHRAPMSFVRELIRQDIKDLNIIKTAGALDVDMLCFSGNCRSVSAGFVSFENKFGLANHYRKSVQDGIVKANEHACYTIMSALRASQMNVPFMPVYGLKNSDLIAANDYFKKVKDPFTNEEIVVVKAISPDISVIHVHACDEFGNAEILGPRYDDILLAKASKKVVITTEKLVNASYFKNNPSKCSLSGVLVNHVVLSPNGSKPGSMFKKYQYDEPKLKEYFNAINKDMLFRHIEKYKRQDQQRRSDIYAY